ASSLIFALSSASFCGDSAIPFTLEVLADGQPKLGCARPTCFGWVANGQPASATGAFYRINSNVDGYMRTGPESIPAFGPEDARFYRPQIAVCEPAFASSSCPALNQWVGGIAPLMNVTAFQTTLQCCAFDGLLQSEDRGVASLHAGQAFVGGEVNVNGQQVGFDYVSNVAKSVLTDGTVQYDVSVRRMPCASFDDASVPAKIPKQEVAQAFQAPNLAVNQPLPLPPAGGENQILEEVVQQEAVQFPQDTVFQPAPPPPPTFQPPPQFVQPPPQQFFAPVQAAPVQYSPPVQFYSGGGGGGGNAQWCFAEDSIVELIDGSIKRMDELEKKDWVLTVGKEGLSFEQVEFWLHRVPDQEAIFNEFETED
ncbi:hypothetical protein PENTCL1PPCAC_14372, partial [Pristionchus entomophagus]